MITTTTNIIRAAQSFALALRVIACFIPVLATACRGAAAHTILVAIACYQAGYTTRFYIECQVGPGIADCLNLFTYAVNPNTKPTSTPLAAPTTVKPLSVETFTITQNIPSCSFVQPVYANLNWVKLVEEKPTCAEVDIISIARDRYVPTLNLTALKLYKLRGETVIQVKDIPTTLPTTMKRYKLRGTDVVKLAALENFTDAIHEAEVAVLEAQTVVAEMEEEEARLSTMADDVLAKYPLL